MLGSDDGPCEEEIDILAQVEAQGTGGGCE